jgi:Flp pilus assembly protein TadD
MSSKQLSRKQKKQTPVPDTAQADVTVPVSARHLLAVIVLLFVGTICYANTFSVPFILDDVTSILTNPLVKDFDLKLKSRILGDLSFALNYRLHGLDLAGYHVVNLLLHLLNAAMIYSLVQVIFATPLLRGSVGDEKDNRSTAAMMIGLGAALIFVSHPLQTQAVTYLAQRVAVLATTFYLGALLCYAGSRLSARRSTAAALLLLSLLLAMAGILTKENAITVPLAIMLFEVTFFRGDLRRRLLPLAWYLLPLVAAPMAVIGRIGFSADLLGEVGRMTAEGGAPPRLTYLLTQFPVIVSYLRLFFFPVGQNLDHDVPLRTSLLDPAVLVSIILLAALAGAGFYSWRVARRVAGKENPLLALPAFGIGWFFITLLVESSVISIRDVMFEHRLYLPSVGMVIGISATEWGCVCSYAQRRATTVFMLVLTAVTLLLSSATVMRNRVWRAEVTLWQDVVSKSPLKARAHGALGHAYQRAGRQEAALHCYLEAVRLAPIDHVARNNLGTIHLLTNRPAEALAEFEAALQRSPLNAEVHYNKGIACEKLGRLNEAAAAYGEALRLKSDHDKAAYNLAFLLYRQGRVAEAVQNFKRAVELNPDNTDAVRNLEALEKGRRQAPGR